MEAIPSIVDELLSVVMDSTRADHVRYHAALGHVLLGQSSGENVEWEIEVVRRYIRTAQDRHLASLAEDIIQTLQDYGGISH